MQPQGLTEGAAGSSWPGWEDTIPHIGVGLGAAKDELQLHAIGGTAVSSLPTSADRNPWGADWAHVLASRVARLVSKLSVDRWKWTKVDKSSGQCGGVRLPACLCLDLN